MFFHLYGLLIGIGIWVGSLVNEKAHAYLKPIHKNYRNFTVDQALLWIFIPALIGARAYHVVDLWEWYASQPHKIIAIWEGGIGIYGAILGGVVGALGLAIWLQRNRSWKYEARSAGKTQPFRASVVYTSYPFLRVILLQWAAILDVLMVGVPVAQAIGRFGNYVNQELFGRPTDLPWAIFIDAQHRPAGYETVAYYHPLFLYEAILNLALAAYLWTRVKSNPNRGELLGWYLIGYGVVRFCLDFLRINPWQGGVLTVAQWVSLGGICLGVMLLTGGRKWKVEN